MSINVPMRYIKIFFRLNFDVIGIIYTDDALLNSINIHNSVIGDFGYI